MKRSSYTFPSNMHRFLHPRWNVHFVLFYNKSSGGSQFGFLIHLRKWYQSRTSPVSSLSCPAQLLSPPYGCASTDVNVLFGEQLLQFASGSLVISPHLLFDDLLGTAHHFRCFTTPWIAHDSPWFFESLQKLVHAKFSGFSSNRWFPHSSSSAIGSKVSTVSSNRKTPW